VNDPLDRPVKETEYHASASTDMPAGTTTTTLTYSGDTNAVSLESASGALVQSRSYSFDALGNRLTVADGTNRYSYLYNPHGDVTQLIDQSSTLKASYGYTAYGAKNDALTKTSGFNAATNPYRYSGKRFDTGSGTYDMGARRYSPATGRFMQMDMYYGALDDLGLSSDPPQSNRYLFTGANPIGLIELDGHTFAPIVSDQELSSCGRDLDACARERVVEAQATAANVCKGDTDPPPGDPQTPCGAAAKFLQETRVEIRSYFNPPKTWGQFIKIGLEFSSYALLALDTPEVGAFVRVSAKDLGEVALRLERDVRVSGRAPKARSTFRRIGLSKSQNEALQQMITELRRMEAQTFV
jgi:RHS repeat-associated protein